MRPSTFLPYGWWILLGFSCWSPLWKRWKGGWKKLEGPRDATNLSQQRLPRITNKRWNRSLSFQCPSLFMRGGVSSYELSRSAWNYYMSCVIMYLRTRLITNAGTQVQELFFPLGNSWLISRHNTLLPPLWHPYIKKSRQSCYMFHLITSFLLHTLNVINGFESVESHLVEAFFVNYSAHIQSLVHGKMQPKS